MNDLSRSISPTPRKSSRYPCFFERKATEEKLRAAIDEKDVLLKELHHRVKNNLQIISSLISMQAAHSKLEQELSFLDDLKERIHAIGLIHDKLRNPENADSVILKEYLSGLAESIYSGLCDREQIRLEVDLAENLGRLPIDQAISCGLVVNEALSNSCKYAFPEGRKGQITVSGRRIEDTIYVEVKDDGIGISAESKRAGSLGIELIETLVDQLDGKHKIISNEGTRLIFQFPSASS